MPSGNILLIDDESKLRSLLKRIISLEGYSVFEAADIKSALRISTREDIEVIVCDVKLPDGSLLSAEKQAALLKDAKTAGLSKEKAQELLNSHEAVA